LLEGLFHIQVHFLSWQIHPLLDGLHVSVAVGRLNRVANDQDFPGLFLKLVQLLALQTVDGVIRPLSQIAWVTKDITPRSRHHVDLSFISIQALGYFNVANLDMAAFIGRQLVLEGRPSGVQ